MKRIPDITVLMPVYNAGKYLHNAIDSILNQSFSDFEFLIINDGSTDNSPEIIKSYNDQRIRLVTNEHNAGITFTLNRGLSLASGKYIARMDADDISLPGRLAAQYDFMQKNPEVILSGGMAEKTGPDGETLGIIRIPEDDASLQTMLFFSCCFIHPLVIFDKSKALSAGGYSANDLHAEDYGLWIRMKSSGRLANLNQVLLKYRWTGENISARQDLMQQATTFDISYTALNATISGKMSKEDYRRFYYLWKFQTGNVRAETIIALAPLWNLSSKLPHASELLGRPWMWLGLFLIRGGNVSAGLTLLNVLKQKLRCSPSLKEKIFATARGLLKPVKNNL